MHDDRCMTEIRPAKALSPQPPRVLVLEDEPHLREAIVSYLNTEPVSAHGAGSIAQASAWCERHDFDILILDLGLPDGDGLQWLADRRALAQKGVIILSARGLPTHRLAGLKAGADVYLVKPVPLEEIVLHVHKLSARLRMGPVARTSGSLSRRRTKADSPGWQLHASVWQLLAPNGKSLTLKLAEKLLLQLLLGSAGEVVGKAQIIESLGGKVDSYDYRRIETLVRRLRARCRKTLATELPILTVYGRGLAFTEPGTLVLDAGTIEDRTV
jgi:DNA-binding response OmpR family regulator